MSGVDVTLWFGAELDNLTYGAVAVPRVGELIYVSDGNASEGHRGIWRVTSVIWNAHERGIGHPKVYLASQDEARRAA